MRRLNKTGGDRQELNGKRHYLSRETMCRKVAEGEEEEEEEEEEDIREDQKDVTATRLFPAGIRRGGTR